MSVRKLSFCAMCVALAFAAGLIRLFSFPFGGAVTLCSMLFLVLPGWFFGLPCGLLCGTVYGLLSFAFSPYYISFFQFLFDYLLSFSVMGIAGLFRSGKNGLLIGYIAAVFGRWIMASIAGLFWISLGSVAWEGWAPLPYTMAYNGAYLFSEAVITVLLLLIPSVRNALERVRQLANR